MPWNFTRETISNPEDMITRNLITTQHCQIRLSGATNLVQFLANRCLLGNEELQRKTLGSAVLENEETVETDSVRDNI